MVKPLLFSQRVYFFIQWLVLFCLQPVAPPAYAQVWPTTVATVEEKLQNGNSKAAVDEFCLLAQAARLQILEQFKQSSPLIFEAALSCTLTSKALAAKWSPEEYEQVLKNFDDLLQSGEEAERAIGLRVIQAPFIEGSISQLQRLVAGASRDEKVLLANALGRGLGRGLGPGQNKKINRLLIRLLEDDVEEVQAAALFAFRKKPTPIVAPTLLHLIFEGSSLLQGQAALLLGVLGQPEFEFALLRAMNDLPTSSLVNVAKALALYGTDSALESLLGRLRRELDQHEPSITGDSWLNELLEVLVEFQKPSQIELRAAFIKKVPPRWLSIYLRRQLKKDPTNRDVLALAFQEPLLDCMSQSNLSESFSFHGEICLQEALRLGAASEPFLPLLRAGQVSSARFFDAILETDSENTLLYAVESLNRNSKVRSAALGLLSRSSPLPKFMLPELRSLLQTVRLSASEISKVLQLLFFAPRVLREAVVTRYAQATPAVLRRDILALRIIGLETISDWESLIANVSDAQLLQQALAQLPLSRIGKTRRLFLQVLIDGSRFRSQLIDALSPCYLPSSDGHLRQISDAEFDEIASLARLAPTSERDGWRFRYFTIALAQSRNLSTKSLLHLLGNPMLVSTQETALLNQYLPQFKALSAWTQSGGLPGTEGSKAIALKFKRGGANWSEYQLGTSLERLIFQRELSSSSLQKALLFENTMPLRFRAAVLLSTRQHGKLERASELATAYRQCAAYEKTESLKRFCRVQLGLASEKARSANYIYRTAQGNPVRLFPLAILQRNGEFRLARSDRQGRLYLKPDDLASFSQLTLY